MNVHAALIFYNQVKYTFFVTMDPWGSYPQLPACPLCNMVGTEVDKPISDKNNLEKLWSLFLRFPKLKGVL
jgi:hypothetical protein